MLRDNLGRRASDNSEPFLMNTPVAGTEQTGEHSTQNDLNDDIFGSAPASPVISPQDGHHDREPVRRSGVEHSDIPRLRSTHVTNGYREGIAISKEQYIQAGFDEGYSLGGEIGTKAGLCLGVLDGLSRGLAAARKASSGNNDDAARRISEAWLQAQEELKVERLLGRDFFGPDGIWLYEVPGQDANDDELQATFQDVADAHPVLKIWRQRIQNLTHSVGLSLRLTEGMQKRRTSASENEMQA